MPGLRCSPWVLRWGFVWSAGCAAGASRVGRTASSPESWCRAMLSSEPASSPSRARTCSPQGVARRRAMARKGQRRKCSMPVLPPPGPGARCPSSPPPRPPPPSASGKDSGPPASGQRGRRRRAAQGRRASATAPCPTWRSPPSTVVACIPRRPLQPRSHPRGACHRRLADPCPCRRGPWRCHQGPSIAEVPTAWRTPLPFCNRPRTGP
mmetsp:Transcript_17498/g.61145  ORF Transcript_17498/g.61145 Transcript_17498/m.61145 type:complete len:209 (-) Transcript_17498:524-1150(-)